MLTNLRSTTGAATLVDEATAVVVQGDLDVTSGPALRRALREAFDRGARHVVVDLDDVSFVDASGLGVLVGGHRLYTGNGGTFRVVAPQASVQRVLEVTGLARVFGTEGAGDRARRAS